MSNREPSNRTVDYLGPIAGSASLASTAFNLSDVGYVEEEYFLEGLASRFDPEGDLGADGRWQVRPGAQAPFKTRIVVYRPGDLARFTGVVAVEWLNVSAGFDMCPDWIYMHREMIRAGAAWIGVSAQKVGIEGTGAAAFGPPRHLKVADPARYAGLDHPGDAYAFDTFASAGRLAREGRLFGGVRPPIVVATGHSQSAAYLVTYINAVDRLDPVFDGFLVHGRPGAAAPLDGAGALARTGRRADIRIRDDGRSPVLTVQAETDVIGGLMSVGSRQPDSDCFRLWEIAGAAHGDNYVALAGAMDSGLAAPTDLAALMKPTRTLFGLSFDEAANCAPQHHYVLNAAFFHLVRWIQHGAAPPQAPVLDVASIDPPAFRLDPWGNALGGVRTPWIDAPTAISSGLAQSASPLSALLGFTRPFSAETLEALYPQGRGDYRRLFDEALEQAVAAGFVLEADRAECRALSDALYPEAP